MMTTNKPEKTTLGIYLHLPFCMAKCSYCDFLSFQGISQEEQRQYLQVLKKEMTFWGEHCREKFQVDTLFIGGGTPSMLNSVLIADIMEAVRTAFCITEKAEVTIESNPKTLSEEKLTAYLQAGINRLSMGVQSLDDGLLRRLGRMHDRTDAVENYRLARACGFQNINLDLMFAIPGQTPELWRETITQTIDLRPEHISFYGLQLEEGTELERQWKRGEWEMLSDNADRQMYHEALHLLRQSGYDHYEISNAALPGKACRHNLKYWSAEPYLGLGLGAHSFIGETRWSNLTTLSAYLEAGNQMFAQPDSSRSEGIEGELSHWTAIASSNPFTADYHENSTAETGAEYLFTGLRKCGGISLSAFEAKFGQPLELFFSAQWPGIQAFIHSGKLVIAGDACFLSAEGRDISNRVMAEFL